jgi:hypothetical protein
MRPKGMGQATRNRPFWFRLRRVGTNPWKKDYFINIDEQLFDRYAYDYYKNMQLDMHRVSTNDYNDLREINGLGKIDSSYVGAHCAVRVVRDPSISGEAYGETIPVVGVPCEIQEIRIYEDFIWATLNSFCTLEEPPCCRSDIELKMTMSVLAHESGHAHHIDHYEWGATPEFTCMVTLEPFDLYCFTDPPDNYGVDDMAQLRIY